MISRRVLARLKPGGGLRSVPLTALLGAAALAAGLAVVYAFPPGQSPFYPRCALFSLTGLYCPGCGSSRAVHAMLHGRFADAAGYNLLAACLVPPGLALALAQLYSALRYKRFLRLAVPGMAIGVAVGLTLLFGVLRNLPWEPLKWLAP